MIEANSIPIADITIGDRVRQDLGDLAELSQSITANGGLIQPIVVTRDLRLVCGERRLAALAEADWTEAPVVYIDTDNGAAQALAERDENTCRKPFSPVEASRARDRVRDAFAEASKARQGTRTDLEHCGNLPQSDEQPQRTKTRELASSGTGYSGRTLDKVDQIRSAAERGVVKQGKTEREVPDEVREVAQQGLKDVSQTGAAVDKSYQRLTSALDQYVEEDPDVQRSKKAKKFWDELHALSKVDRFDPTEYVDALTSEEWESAELLVNGLERWISRFRQARPTGLRVVKEK